MEDGIADDLTSLMVENITLNIQFKNGQQEKYLVKLTNTSDSDVEISMLGINDNGETYGILDSSKDIEQAPDLILAVALNRNKGYIRKTDWIDNSPQSLDEVKNMKQEPRKVPVYKSDGCTIIGDFILDSTPSFSTYGTEDKSSIPEWLSTE